MHYLLTWFLWLLALVDGFVEGESMIWSLGYEVDNKTIEFMVYYYILPNLLSFKSGFELS